MEIYDDKKEKLQKEIEELESKLNEINSEIELAEQLREERFLNTLKKLDSLSTVKSKEKLFSAVYLLLIFICIFFAIAYEVYSSYDIRKRQKAMISSIEDSHNRINLLASYVSVLDENMQIIPDILKRSFGQTNNLAAAQIKEFKHISEKSIESFEKVKEIGVKSKEIIDEVTSITKAADKSDDKIESLKTKSTESIEKIENIVKNAEENKVKVKTLIQEEQESKIITYLNKYKSRFNSYKTKNDLSLVYKMVIVDEIGSVDYDVILEAFKKYKFRNYPPPDKETLIEWDKNMVELCSNALSYLRSLPDLKMDIKRKDRCFDSFKSNEDYTNYKKWGYFDETLNYADLITFYQNTLNSVKSRMEFNK